MAKKASKRAHNGVVIPNIDLKKIHQKLAIGKEAAEELIISRMQFIGERCVTVARQNGSYGDVTGNLRSSIGYVIIKNGKVITLGASEQFSGPKGDGHEGSTQGQAFLKKLSGRYSRGIVLIVVAGMRYAEYVERVAKKDVLTSAELIAEKLLKEQLDGVIE